MMMPGIRKITGTALAVIFILAWLSSCNNATERFNINANKLPQDHIAINRVLLIWETNPVEFKLILTVVVLVLLILLGIIFFLKEASKKEADKNIRLLLDALPMCCQLWDRNFKTMDCNQAAVDLYGFKNKQEYIERFLECCSPEYQPDGQLSREKARIFVNKAFEDGYCKLEWMHKHLNGEPMPA